MPSRVFRRTAACALLWALLMTACPSGAMAASFRDVPATHWAADAINRCAALGFFQGESATSFGLGHKISRAAFVVALSRFFGWESGQPQALYDDVPATAWYAGAVTAAYENDAITRQSEDFRSADPITREEMAVMLVRALGYGSIAAMAQEDDLPFTDVETNLGYIAMAYEMGIVTGTGETTFSPEGAATREQAAVVLMRLYDRMQSPMDVMAVVDDPAADLTGVDVAAISAGRLIAGSTARINQLMRPADAAAAVEAVHQAGGTALLRITGAPSVLHGSHTDNAAAVAQMVREGGYDGVYLDVEQSAGDRGTYLTKLVTALRQALGAKALLYVAVDAPTREGTQREYAAIGQTANRVVVRLAAEQEVVNGFPIAPTEPMEQLYEALALMDEQVPGAKLTVQLTTSATAWTKNGGFSSLSGERAMELMAQAGDASAWSGRYGCAYFQWQDTEERTTVVWYPDARGTALRTQLLRCFEVSQVCFTGVTGLASEMIAAV